MVMPRVLFLFKVTKKKAYNGMALVIVKANKGQKGSFTVKAESEGLSASVVSVKIK